MTRCPGSKQYPFEYCNEKGETHAMFLHVTHGICPYCKRMFKLPVKENATLPVHKGVKRNV